MTTNLLSAQDNYEPVQIAQVTHGTNHVLTHGSQEQMHLPAQCRIEAALNHQPLPRVDGTCKFVDLQCGSDPCPTAASASASQAPPVIRPGLTSPMTFRADDGVPEAGCLPPRSGDFSDGAYQNPIMIGNYVLSPLRIFGRLVGGDWAARNMSKLSVGLSSGRGSEASTETRPGPDPDGCDPEHEISLFVNHQPPDTADGS
jgi:hypothetical protein